MGEREGMRELGKRGGEWGREGEGEGDRKEKGDNAGKGAGGAEMREEDRGREMVLERERGEKFFSQKILKKTFH